MTDQRVAPRGAPPAVLIFVLIDPSLRALVLFTGVSLLVTAIRVDAGCEVMTLPRVMIHQCHRENRSSSELQGAACLGSKSPTMDGRTPGVIRTGRWVRKGAFSCPS